MIHANCKRVLEYLLQFESRKELHLSVKKTKGLKSFLEIYLPKTIDFISER